MPIIIDRTEVRLDIHIYPIIDFNLLLGFPLEELLGTPQGSLYENLSETASATSCLKNFLAKPHFEQNPLEMVMRVSPFISSEPALFEGAEPSTPKEDDSKDFCEDERPSPPSIKFEPLLAGPTSAFHEDS
jgi:hypothetical protein